MSNINDTYFDGHYKDIWKAIIPEDLTVKEVDFMVNYFKLQPGAHVLDLMCGYGRHAIALGRKGIHVTAVDNLSEYVAEAQVTVKKENLPVEVIQSDILTFKTSTRFDLVLCMGNSINFFDAADTQKLLNMAGSSLKTGGYMLINSWSIAEIAVKNFKERSWSRIGDKKFLVESNYFFNPARIESEHNIILADGSSEIKKGIDYVFSVNELGTMLKQAGLELIEVYSIPGRKKFVPGEPRAYLVAQKSS